MNTYVTHTDQLSGWLLVIGCGFVAAVWVVLANYPRLSDWWADLRAPAKADRIIATGATFAHTLDAGQAEYAERDAIADSLTLPPGEYRRHVEAAIAKVRRANHAPPVSVPEQRTLVE